ncbi:probable WRKY transcription factor protein 1 isoform X2 [Aricia agestis]|uniref:probable WRKY transcription factor protein 1 isoform X2 n=1 Tax=Aricia agestis TaxID=91739 RepID=UPI001C20BD5E|nr:probable WRKY transcription factor protein 1 isoform X2 [Aricia agestis]
MQQIQAETEDDILRKLEAFDWSKKPTVVIEVLSDDDNQCNSLVGKANTNHNPEKNYNQNTYHNSENNYNQNTYHNPENNYNQNTYHNQDTNRSRENGRKHQESNSESNKQQPPLFQITNVGQPNIATNIRGPQRNEDLQQSLNTISYNLILIARKYDSLAYSNFLECTEFKKNVFTLLNSMVSNIIIPRSNDLKFVYDFLRHTLNLGLRNYNYYASYICLEILFQEMINFTNSQQNKRNETDKNQSNHSNLDILENMTVSSFFNASSTISNKETNQKAKRRKSNLEAETKANKSNNSQVHGRDAMNPLRSTMEGSYSTHYNSSDQSNIGQQAMSRCQPPPYPCLSEVAMSPVSLDGDDTRQPGYTTPGSDVPLSPSISFVTSLNPARMKVADGYCRICSRITNRICLGCSKMNTITYYCSQMCQEKEWPSHMFYCWRSI